MAWKWSSMVAVGVVAARDDVRLEVVEHLARELRGDPQAARGVLAVDHDPVRPMLLAKRRQEVP